jgi:hypothetical protein
MIIYRIYTRYKMIIYVYIHIQSDSKLLSGFTFIGHGNPDNNVYHPVQLRRLDSVQHRLPVFRLENTVAGPM